MVTVLVIASPTFNDFASGSHLSDILRSRAAITVPSPSDPGGVRAGKETACVVTSCLTVGLPNPAFDSNRIGKAGMRMGPARCAKTANSYLCVVNVTSPTFSEPMVGDPEG